MNLIEAASSGAVKGLADGIGGLAMTIREVITGKASPEKQHEALVELARLEANAQMMQLEVNKAEAQHPNVFIAGWRPFIGWCCGAGIMYQFIGHPLLTWACSVWWPAVTPPTLATDQLMTLVLSLLGLGGLRTFEKVRDAAGNH